MPFFSGFATDHVYKTINGGNNWISINGDLPDVPTNTIFIDPANNEHIYVGNDLGVYFSENGGDTWETFCNELPEATLVMDLDISLANRKLRIATHGHGIYQRDLVGDPPSAIAMHNSITGFSVFPNPTVNVVNIDIEINEPMPSATVEMYSSLGQKVASIYEGGLQIGVNNFSWNPTENISAGTYYIKLTADGYSVSKTLIIQ